MKTTLPVKRLGDFVRIQTGKLDANASISNGEFPFFTCAQDISRIDWYSYDCECVLVAGNGDLNVKYYKGKFNAYQRTYIIESLNNLLDIRYLYYFMSLYVDNLRRMSIGGVIKYIKLAYLTEVPIPLPPLEEQRRIAAILDKADAVRRKRQEAIALTEELLRSAFLEMFGDPVTNPKGWEIVSLGDHLSFVTSGSRGWAQYYSSTGARFIRSLDVRMNHISDVDAVFVNVPNSAEAKRTRVEEGDVLLTITGSRIGRVAPVPEGFETAYISQHVAILRPKPTISPQYLSFFLSIPSGGQRQIASMQYGQTKPGLNLSQVSSFQVPLPSMEKQRKFDFFWSRHHSALNNQITALARDNSLFNSLLQRAFRGKL